MVLQTNQFLFPRVFILSAVKIIVFYYLKKSLNIENINSFTQHVPSDAGSVIALKYRQKTPGRILLGPVLVPQF